MTNSISKDCEVEMIKLLANSPLKLSKNSLKSKADENAEGVLEKCEQKLKKLKEECDKKRNDAENQKSDIKNTTNIYNDNLAEFKPAYESDMTSTNDSHDDSVITKHKVFFEEAPVMNMHYEDDLDFMTVQDEKNIRQNNSKSSETISVLGSEDEFVLQDMTENAADSMIFQSDEDIRQNSPESSEDINALENLHEYVHEEIADDHEKGMVDLRRYHEIDKNMPIQKLIQDLRELKEMGELLKNYIDDAKQNMKETLSLHNMRTASRYLKP